MRIKHKWTEVQLSFLKDNYKYLKLKEISEKLGLSMHTVRAKAYELDLSKEPHWTDQEIAYLTSNYNSTPIAEISDKIGKSVAAVYSKAKFLKISKRGAAKIWSDDEINFITENYQKLTLGEIGIRLNRTQSVVFLKVKQLGLNKNNLVKDDSEYITTSVRLTRGDMKFLHDYYGGVSKALERTIQAVKFLTKK